MSERKTLKELLLFPYEFDQRKHELHEDHAENTLNNMSRMGFLTALSDALEEWQAQSPTQE